jgi:hypothetical protein
MARLIAAQHGDDLFVSVQWVDGYGAHQRRATEDLPEAITKDVQAVMRSRPEVKRWELRKPGDVVQIGKMMDGEDEPKFTGSESVAVRNAASRVMDWVNGYASEWVVKNDIYEEGKDLDRLRDHLERRAERLDSKKAKHAQRG